MPPLARRLLLIFIVFMGLIPAAFAQSPPVGITDNYTVGRGGTLVVGAPGLLFNDSDPDGDAISVISIFDMPSNGVLVFGANGSFTYVHNGSPAGTDSFVYVLADTDPGTPNVNVTVNLTIVAADAVAPAVTSVTVPAAGNYLVGQNLDFSVHFDENVYVDTMAGTPSLAVTLDTGGTVQASYVSGSGTTSLLFRMTVAGGQQDLDGIALGPVIALNGGTVRDLAANNAQLGLNGVPLTDNVLVAAPVAAVSVPLLGTWTTWALALMVAAGGLGVARRR